MRGAAERQSDVRMLVVSAAVAITACDQGAVKYGSLLSDWSMVAIEALEDSLCSHRGSGRFLERSVKTK